ncbi:MAG: 4Fe-4S binding domain protein [Sporomusa sp.]|jgi:2-oxoglutarate ferredoxin oxidoreductase subunit delta|nr:4Fe-4S binding domain protein [Sporomusa sp.]
MALSVKPKLCKGCGICVHFCPKSILDLDDMGKIYIKDPENCIVCGQCELRCPDYAVKVTKEEKIKAENDGRDTK